MLAPETRVYKLVLDNGDCPIDDWVAAIKDVATRARILWQIDKVQRENLGQHRFFDGIGELKLDFGPGYRVYFALHGSLIVLLLGGGDKKSQSGDIDLARNRFAKWKKDGSTIEPLVEW